MDYISDTFWEVTYRKNIAKMIGVCWRYTQNRQIAEDLAHDAFVVAIDKVSGFENKGPFEAWLRRIVVNVALQYLREQKRQEKLGQAALHFDVSEDVSEEIIPAENPAFSEAELLEAIGKLPDHHRLVFNLYVIDNLTHAEIAAQLGISEGTSKSHLARARKKIKEILFDKLSKDKERKKALVWWTFPFWNVDRLVADRLQNFRINSPSKSPAISNGALLKTAALITTVIISYSAFILFDINSVKPANAIEPVIFERPDSIPAHVQQKISTPETATIPESSIIVVKTKNEGPMKNLKTLGGLLIAGIMLDTASTAKPLAVGFENRQHHLIDYNPKINPSISEAKTELLHGTFYASSILWSDDQGKLLLFGNDVKVNLNNQKFTGKGKFSFLNNIKYLVVNGRPVKLNETVDLERKKYNLTQLSELDGEKKYGESGKYGVVEITLAE